MKRFLYLILAVLLFATSLTGCESNAQKEEALAGVWSMPIEAEEELVTPLLETIGMGEVELAVLTEVGFTYYANLEFKVDGTFCAVMDVESMRNGVRELFEETFDVLYNNIAVLEEAYDISFYDCTRGEFQQFYAEAMDFTTYGDMIDYLVENCYSYDVLGEDFAGGTYKVKGNRIILEDTIGDLSGETEYKLEGDQLTLYVADGTEVYTRQK